jgi:hypothetical protein
VNCEGSRHDPGRIAGSTWVWPGESSAEIGLGRNEPCGVPWLFVLSCVPHWRDLPRHLFMGLWRPKAQHIAVLDAKVQRGSENRGQEVLCGAGCGYYAARRETEPVSICSITAMAGARQSVLSPFAKNL